MKWFRVSNLKSFLTLLLIAASVLCILFGNGTHAHLLSADHPDQGWFQVMIHAHYDVDGDASAENPATHHTHPIDVHHAHHHKPDGHHIPEANDTPDSNHTPVKHHNPDDYYTPDDHRPSDDASSHHKLTYLQLTGVLSYLKTITSPGSTPAHSSFSIILSNEVSTQTWELAQSLHSQHHLPHKTASLRRSNTLRAPPAV